MLAERVAQGGFVVWLAIEFQFHLTCRITIGFSRKQAAFPIGSLCFGQAYCIAQFIYCFHYDQGVPQVHFELLSDTVNPKRAGARTVVPNVGSKIRAEVRQSLPSMPLQWFNFFDFWHESSPMPLSNTDIK